MGSSRGVPRETSAAAAVFGSRLATAERYAEALRTSAVERGLIGPREAGVVWSRHVLNCAVVAELLDEGTSSLIDVGSGAGLPGIPLVIAHPGMRVYLAEPLLRRATWLRGVVADLDLEGVEVVRARAEELAGEPTVPPADVVTARALAPLARLIPLCRPMVAPGGRLLAIKGAAVAEEMAAAEAVLRRSGAVASIRTCGVGRVDPPTTVVSVEFPGSG